ncbi:MAG TPA: nucleotidyltransferase [Vicinamibacteria bacterium]|nr:nucleotidyltransferase [Vicinamibacteria bacterium]
MMRSLFRALDDEGVRYLLISGQACVLYGASQFTEDVDLWVQPASSNLESFLRAMARVRAVVYKLTPPITLKYVRKGHGFHFRIGADLFLDMMGHPPRVGAFLAAFSRARKFKTDWGTLRVSAPEDLVLLKRTNRPGDYEAISNLVRLRVVEDKEEASVLRWALLNTFDVADLVDFALQAAGKLNRWPSRPALRALLPIPAATSRLPDRRIRRAAQLLAIEMGDVQERGRRYWRPIVSELKRLQVRRKLIPEGTSVASFLEEG